MDNGTEMVGSAAIGGPPRLRIVLHEYLRSVALALSHHADVETSIEQLARRCKEVDGVFTLLWHNISDEPAWAVSSPLYGQVLHSLANMVG